MRLWLLGCLAIAAAAPCYAQVGDPVTMQVAGREIVARDFVGAGQFTVEADGTIEVPDYEFSAVLPKGCKVQIGDSGGHVHGFVVRLGREGCGAPASERFMRIWADFNVLDQPDALSHLRAYASTCDPGKPAWADGGWSGAVDGLRTASCRRELADGRIEITLLAMGGKWPNSADALPRISYEINLSTTRSALELDMAVFREFVCSIDMTGDGSGSTLCRARVS